MKVNEPGMGNRMQIAIDDLFRKYGGLRGLIGQFEQRGLGRLTSSWVALGPNIPITTEQMHHAIPPSAMSAAAATVGVSIPTVTRQLAALLPGVIDKMTPDGTLPPL